MNELERTALNEILRTVTYIAEKVDELDSKISLSINDNQEMTEEETIELLKFLSTDYGRGYLSGLASGLSILLEFLKKAE